VVDGDCVFVFGVCAFGMGEYDRHEEARGKKIRKEKGDKRDTKKKTSRLTLDACCFCCIAEFHVLSFGI
jgi:hypothetical protein